MSNFSRRFKELRQRKCLSQEEIAKKLKISRSAVGNYEQGTREPDHDKLEEIADFFNVDIDYLLGRKEWTTEVMSESELIYDKESHTWNAKQGYYVNEDANEYAQFLMENPGHKILFDAARNVKPGDLQKALKALGIFIDED